MTQSESSRFLNGFKCPICNSRIDISYMHNIYICSRDYTHYTVEIKLYDSPPKVLHEIVNVYDKKHKFIIIKDFYNEEPKFFIEVYDIDQEGRITFEFTIKKISLEEDCFDFKNFNVDKAINRIKTLFLFS